MGEFKPQSISFSAVNILFSITATLGNSLILATLHKESSPHPPSKLFYRCLATTDLLVFLVTQPVAATYWMSLVHEHWIRYPRDVGYITGFTLRGVWSFSVYNDGHKREPTSRRVVGTEIQRYCHSEVHVHHFSYSLGCMSSRWFILSTRSPYNLMVQPYKYIIFSGDLSRLIHKDFSRSQSLSGSNTRSCSTTAEPTKCTEHGAIQKGSVQCTMGAVSFSCLLCTTIYDANCNLS